MQPWPIAHPLILPRYVDMLKDDAIQCRNKSQGTVVPNTGLIQGDSIVQVPYSATSNSEKQSQLDDVSQQEERSIHVSAPPCAAIKKEQQPWLWLQSQRSETATATTCATPGIDLTGVNDPTNSDQNAPAGGDPCDQVQSQPRWDHASSVFPSTVDSACGNGKCNEQGSHSAPCPRFASENPLFHLMGTNESRGEPLAVVQRDENKRKMGIALILSSAAAPLADSWQAEPCVSSQSSVSSISFSSSPSSPYSYSFSSPTSRRSSFPSPSPYTRDHPAVVPTFSLFPALPTCSSPTSASPSIPPAELPPSRLRQRSAPDLRLSLHSNHTLSRSPSLSSFLFSPGASTQDLSSPATTSTTFTCAYSQPFLSVPSPITSSGHSNGIDSGLSSPNSLSLLQELDVAFTNQLTVDMTRQRSHSASSIGGLAKSPSSLLTSLSASVALHDSHQPKSLQDILLLAQSHYISHRYIPALALYKVAAEQHNSIPACGSLFALYTSTVTAPGLVKSDTKATLVLMHALRIWMARRWSSSSSSHWTHLEGASRSKARDDEDELEEYFAHSRPIRPLGHSGTAGKSIPIRSRTSIGNSSRGRTALDEWTNKSIAESMMSEYRTPRVLQDRPDPPAGQESPNMGLIPASNTPAENLCSDSGEESQDESEAESDADEDDDDDEEEEEGVVEEQYEGQAQEEEQRRIGQATEEIEDIVHKLCRMIQKGVLGLQETVLVEAVSLLRRMDKGLKKEADIWKKTVSQSRSLFSSPSADFGSGEGLLLTRAFDLSFLDLDADTERSTPSGLSDITNAAIANLSGTERDLDWTWCRAIRIRLMFTLGWVHQQKGEYHYGAQAYGVCSEIESTGKRGLDMLQQQASAQRRSCQTMEEHKSAHQGHASEAQSNAQPSVSKTLPVTVKATVDTPTRRRNRKLNISSPSSLSSSESGNERRSNRGTSNTFSSLSEVVWGSALFKSSASSSRASTASTAPSMISADQSTPSNQGRSGAPRLHRSMSASDTHLEAQASKEHKSQDISGKEPKHLPTPQRQGPSRQVSALTLTMVGHQSQLVQCSHCGNKRVQMPLCVCKKARYCNLECRQADMERHCLTGCHASHSTAIHQSMATRSNENSNNSENAPSMQVACTDA
ncbi:hypothetical protein EMPS_04730 [Entomortierella parvispora]|uniref:Uncharacterized protein n=1 Tax=Entomortierella parvispora TaxID=205924 RepID=A0A9P3H9K9_9FUNG|nr:hypothetical protein EMPS_04730 [Entomortierella parvispora]